MDKDGIGIARCLRKGDVSTLVLMDSWIKTRTILHLFPKKAGFNPCFNGFMDKDGI